MQNLPLVSIVTPTYNQAEYLAETIESVLAQDYPNIEYIVLDDGSTDSTPEVLNRYSGRVRWERHDNMGQARTLNKGWAMSRGEFIGYLSSDDLLLPDAISKLVETNDAQITQLNTSVDTETGLMQVTIRINKPEVSDIIATFQRYEYNVKYFFGEELYTNELKSNYDNLMNYLKI